MTLTPTYPDLSADPHRPRYHFQPPANWMNDPNGLLHWRGRYHMFYQHHPDGPLWDDMHWGHAVSTDLVHWRHLPLAMAPTPGGPDTDGVYSGCAVVQDDVPTLVFTGVRGQSQRVCLARAANPDDPDLVEWIKDPGNPVIPEPPAELHLVAYRDPSVWRVGDWWYMVHGVGIVDRGPVALLYRSRDLVTWEERPPALIGDPARSAGGWECPQLFPLGDGHVLMVSAWELRNPKFAFWMAGQFDGDRFEVRSEGKMDGGVFYAPQTFVDGHGRRILFGWLREARTREAMQRAGWSGAMSLPWLLSPGDGDGLPHIAPVPELEALRGTHTHLDARAIGGEQTLEAGGAHLEIHARINLASATTWGLVVRATPDGQECTRLGYDRTADGGVLFIDPARSSLDPDVNTDRITSELVLGPDQALDVRVFLDGSCIEIVGNGRALLSGRVYPTRPDALGLAVYTDGGEAHLRGLDVWEMRSAVGSAGANY